MLLKIYSLVLIIGAPLTHCMEITRLATRSYRRDCNNIKIVERDYDHLLHKLCSIKKRKPKIKREIPELIEPLIEVKQEDQDTVIYMEKNFESFTMLEDFPACLKDDPGMTAKNQEALLRYKRKQKLGYKNYLALLSFKKGKLVLKKNFLNL